MYQLEKEKKLSESLLWELQERYYRTHGPDVWSKRGLPSYATSNALTIEYDAHLILAYLQDLGTQQPAYLFDLGAGSGQCGYLLIKKLRELAPALRFTYVMTDVAAKNIQFWKEHPFLKPYIQEGFLDFAVYRHDQQDPLRLQISGKEMEQGVPLILLCNYYFDTLPQDLFRIHQGKLEEGRVSLYLQEGSPLDQDNPDTLNHLDIEFSYHAVTAESYPEIKEILIDYLKRPPKGPFAIPHGGMTSIDFFSKISKGSLLALIGDHGVALQEDLDAKGDQWIARHMNFSVAVNFDALRRYFEKKGGFIMLPTTSQPLFIMGAAVLGGSIQNFPKTQSVYQETIGRYDINRYYQELAAVSQETPPLPIILSILERGKWDPVIFEGFLPALHHAIPQANEKELTALQHAIQQVKVNFYPISPKKGLFLAQLGELLFAMHQIPQALACFEQAFLVHGPSPELWKSLGACYLELGNKDTALECLLNSEIRDRDTEDKERHERQKT